MGGRTTRISVVMPVYNDPEGVRETLACLCEQAYPADKYEVLVVDNGSTDRTPRIVESFADDHEPVRLLFETDRQGSYAARNTGIRNATGNLIAFIDADMSVDSTWLSSVVDAMDRTSAGYAGCNIEVYVPGDKTSIAATCNQLTGFQIRRNLREDHYAPTAGLVVRPDVFDAVGLFDADLVSSGDMEFGHRVHQAGIEQVYLEDVRMQHPSRTSLQSLLSKHLRIGRGKEQLRRRYPPLYHERDLLDPLAYSPQTYPWAAVEWADHRVGDSDVDVTPALVVQLYLIGYLTKLCHVFGRWYEHGIRRGVVGENSALR